MANKGTVSNKLEKAIEELDVIFEGLDEGTMTNKKAAKALDKPIKRLTSAQRILAPVEDEE